MTNSRPHLRIRTAFTGLTLVGAVAVPSVLTVTPASAVSEHSPPGHR